MFCIVARPDVTDIVFLKGVTLIDDACM